MLFIHFANALFYPILIIQFVKNMLKALCCNGRLCSVDEASRSTHSQIGRGSARSMGRGPAPHAPQLRGQPWAAVSISTPRPYARRGQPFLSLGPSKTSHARRRRERPRLPIQVRSATASARSCGRTTWFRASKRARIHQRLVQACAHCGAPQHARPACGARTLACARGPSGPLAPLAAGSVSARAWRPLGHAHGLADLCG